MKKIALVVPYFGEFNQYFQYFLQSFETNSTIDLLLYTDNTVNYDYPSNVIIKRLSLNQLKEKIQRKLNIPFVLPNPYKLCDAEVV